MSIETKPTSVPTIVKTKKATPVPTIKLKKPTNTPKVQITKSNSKEGIVTNNIIKNKKPNPSSTVLGTSSQNAFDSDLTGESDKKITLLNFDDSFLQIIRALATFSCLLLFYVIYFFAKEIKKDYESQICIYPNLNSNN